MMTRKQAITEAVSRTDDDQLSRYVHQCDLGYWISDARTNQSTDSIYAIVGDIQVDDLTGFNEQDYKDMMGT